MAFTVLALGAPIGAWWAPTWRVPSLTPTAGAAFLALGTPGLIVGVRRLPDQFATGARRLDAAHEAPEALDAGLAAIPG